jgi:hypothetical protein
MSRTVGYVYPALGGDYSFDFGLFRIGGPGLGNCLLSWARASVAADTFGLRRVSPAWPSCKIGRLLRGDHDKRFFADLFHSEPDAVDGAGKLMILATCKRRRFVVPSEIGHDQPSLLYVAWGGVVAPMYFSELTEHRSAIAARLVKMTRRHNLAALKDLGQPDLAVHVRLGDFLVGTADGSFVNRRISLDWYARQIRRVQAEAGRSLDIAIFSDGDAAELNELTKIKGTQLIQTGSPIGDLFGLALAKCLIASASTFSMWAAYLSGAPSIWHPGAHFQQVGDQPDCEIEHSGEVPFPQPFLSAYSAMFDTAGRLSDNRNCWLRLMDDATDAQ